MKAYELLADVRCWTQGSLGRNINGYPVALDDETAAAWCIVGALHHCYGNSLSEQMWIRLGEQAHTCSLSFWNDSPERTHADIVRVLRALDL